MPLNSGNEYIYMYTHNPPQVKGPQNHISKEKIDTPSVPNSLLFLF